MSRIKVTAVFFAFLIVLYACTTTPSTPAQAVYLAETDYAAALSIAVRYKKLPPCPAAVLCAEPAVVAKLIAADANVATAMDTAQWVVRTPGFGTDAVSSALTAVNAAVSAFAKITTNLGVK